MMPPDMIRKLDGLDHVTADAIDKLGHLLQSGSRICETGGPFWWSCTLSTVGTSDTVK